MAFGVFIHRFDSIYDDSPAERYQFPSQYLSRVQACIGDWIIYYEPRKVAETRGYFATAKVAAVTPDPSVRNMFVALIEPGSYLPFTEPVAFVGPGGLVEQGLLNDEGRISGRAQSAVRPLSAADFKRIIDLGLQDRTVLLPRDEPQSAAFEMREEQVPWQFDNVRERISILSTRAVRDRVFRKVVLQAYDERCAMTGLKLINGGGRAEADAAHIRPVQANGPDIVSNGLALSGTAHWMFDRGLISLADDLTILVSRQANDPDSIRALINENGRATAPMRAADRPHPSFLQWHREMTFKQ
ncbi:HNH endonuclease [Glacieibacterium frigidum]|uniref:Restriction endonuclease n=1 Tax=Glacieibacterium frigidum TaxID=2593303 RepID=A0A552UFU8_9SPHN|nr:HNH endonuclease [Glacieibacterium frigidum]TRW17095.1 restriction endonuclease [Glacieibacterium frigidum]